MEEHRQPINKNGFTLLETVLVLAIVSSMSLLFIANIVPIYNQKVLDTFLDTFEKDVMYAQQYALVNEEKAYIVFVPSQNKYTIEGTKLGSILIERKYDSRIKIEAEVFSNRITYNPNGSIRASGTMHISYYKQSYKVVFYLGKGRFALQEL